MLSASGKPCSIAMWTWVIALCIMIDMINRAILMQAIAAIDNAIWDALGKLYNVPLYRLLGGYRDRVPVIAIGGYYYPSDPEHTGVAGRGPRLPAVRDRRH